MKSPDIDWEDDIWSDVYWGAQCLSCGLLWNSDDSLDLILNALLTRGCLRCYGGLSFHFHGEVMMMGEGIQVK